MNKIKIIFSAIVAVALMAGTSFAGDFDQGSWEEFTALTNGTNYLVGTKVVQKTTSRAEGPKTIVVLNYETGQVNYVTAGKNAEMTVPKESTVEYYGVAPAWSEPKGLSETKVKNYKEATQMTPEMDLYLY